MRGRASFQRRLIVGLLMIAQFATAPGIAAALCLGGETSRVKPVPGSEFGTRNHLS